MWDQIRRKIKPWFIRAGITDCELQLTGCNIWVGCGFAHAKIRDFCTLNDLYIVAFLCNNCHNKIETKDEQMEEIILSIRERNKISEMQPYLDRYTSLDESRKLCYSGNMKLHKRTIMNEL